MEICNSTFSASEATSASMPEKRKAVARMRQGLVVLGAAVGLGGGYGSMYFTTLAVFLKPLAAEFALGRTQAAGLGVLSMLGVALGATLIGRLVDRFGPLRVILTCVAFLSVLICLLATVRNNALPFAALSFLIGVVGAGTMAPGYASVLTRQFDKHFGLALGIVGIALGVGGAVMPIVAQSLIADHGWREAYTYIGLLAGATGALACTLIFLGRGRPQESRRGENESASALPGETMHDALRDGRFWLLFMVILVTAVASLGISIHLMALITDRGISAADGARVVALCGVGVGVGRFGCGVALDALPARLVAAVSLIVAAIGAALLAGASSSFATLALGGFMVGFVIGSENDFLAFFVRRYFGLRAFGSINGLLYGSFAVGGLLGPIAFGAGFDATHSYASSLWAAVVALLVTALALQLLGPYRYASLGHEA